ncbi:MAG TPA: dihydrolipoamide acetyltransferase family protein [Solirubrobacteraceae bacterium]|jgi:pyruvate dehydrogenase E2 component (dihydrolipoamide acetyltransferase)|nr:dihydrolipoamide acetyltransferase family protein [Solirubrobacteraceae bacterium]
MTEIVMPRLSDTMEEGTILRWLKADGDLLKRGEELVEIETDKAAMTYESDQDGVLRTLAAEGDTLPVGAVIAHVGDAAETIAGSSATASPNGGGEREGGSRDVEVTVESIVETAGGGASTPAPAPTDSERVKASPLARRIAHERRVDLRTLSGSGLGGRIVKADVEAAPAGAAAGASAMPAPAASAGAAAPPAAREDVTTAKGQTKTIELSRTQRTIARRMAESKATIPDFSISTDVDMEECVKLRAELKRISSADAPTYNDMVVKAVALALREHPRANGSYRDAKLQLHSRVNVGVAVAANDALVVPTVFDADSKALGEIAREARSLAARVRDGTITPPELGGGTFTVSNLGMYGVASFAAIVNPPQAAILSVGAVEQRAVVRDDQLVAHHTMTLTLVCDHRILYGADAAQFLARIRELLQAPASLTL